MIDDIKDLWVGRIAEAVNRVGSDSGIDTQVTLDQILVETPPKRDMGDLAFPMFPFARIFKMGPPQIAMKVLDILQENHGDLVKAAGPYVNCFFDKGEFFGEVLSSVEKQGEEYGSSTKLSDRKIMIEFSCPNTNKPLHLGHLRNDALGESVARILKANGADVCKVNLINDRGVHICKSMLAYQEFGKGLLPEEAGRKSDHYVGDFYVKYNEWSKQDETVEERAQEMLRKWEEGDKEVLKLWETMNSWAIEGIQKTYEATGISFDRVYKESQTYLSGKEVILKGLEEGVFYKDKDGSIRLDLSDLGMDTKVLLRSDGTSVYMTQDIGTAIARQGDFPFDQLIYVVASEQEYHFKVLFHALDKLGYKWAGDLFHLSYGMVNLPEGKMKSREGTVVDADNLLRELSDLAEMEIKAKEREGALEDVRKTAESVALAALHYYLLQVTPKKDMIFNPKESLSFNGNTGPYLQYMTSRISSMLRKAGEQGLTGKDKALYPSDLEAQEWELVRLIGEFPQKVQAAADDFSPALISGYLYDLSKAFSRFYHDCPVLNNSDDQVKQARLRLASGVLQVLKNGFKLINIPFLDKM